MIRPQLYIFSKNREMINCISRYMSIDQGLKYEFTPQTHAQTYSFIEEIESILNKESPKSFLNTAVLFDVTDSNQKLSSEILDPIAEDKSTEQILASLILIYPEVYWIIVGTIFNEPDLVDDINANWKEHFVDASDMNQCITLLKRHQNGYRTLFDPSGLRTQIKIGISNKYNDKNVPAMKENINNVLDKRAKQTAVAIDEEIQHTFFNAYTGYRFGYKCYTITTKSEMDTINACRKENKIEINKSFEDLELSFSDLTSQSVSEKINGKDGDFVHTILNTRRGNYEFLPYDKENRFIISRYKGKNEYNYNFSDYTVDDIDVASFEKESKKKQYKLINDMLLKYKVDIYRYIVLNEKVREEQEERSEIVKKIKDIFNELISIPNLQNLLSENKNLSDKQLAKADVNIISNKRKMVEIFPNTLNNYNYVTKPLSGMFFLRDKLNYQKNFYSNKQAQLKIENLKENPEKQQIYSHSAPYRVLNIAESLLCRTKKIKNNIDDCQDAIHGAILAIEAKELLFGRSMTTALEALSLQHYMEVKAECSFLGVANSENFVKERLKEIKNETERTIKPLNNSDSIDINEKAQSINAQIQIVNNIRQVYNEYEQFDEECVCLNKVRELIQLTHSYNPNKKQNRLISLIEKYFNFLIRDLGNLVLSIIYIIFGFAFIYYFFICGNGISEMYDSLLQSALTFFEMQPGEVIKSTYKLFALFELLKLFVLIEVILAYIHLGVFIAYLYEKISRK